MGSPTPAYPKRQAYFAHRYCRLLTKTCAAQEIGHVAFTLCVTIAHLEDAKRYTGPVTFFNEQLMPLVGVTKWETLDRARQRAAKAGWIHYEAGNRGQRMPGRYWVEIPLQLKGLDDAPCDESQYPAKGEWTPSQYPAKGDREGERQGDREGERQGDREGEHSIPSPSPIRQSAPADAGCLSPSKSRKQRSVGHYSTDFLRFWTAYPLKTGKRAAATAFVGACDRLNGRNGTAPAVYIVERAATFAKSPKGQGQYVPHPSTWLNQDRFEDDPAAWQERNGQPKKSEPLKYRD